MQLEQASASATESATLTKPAGISEGANAHGVYNVTCYGSDGALKWSEEINNVVCTQGKNVALDAFLSGSGYSVVGPYMGLINGSASSAAVTDTMTSHAAWLEVGNANAPAYSGTRKTVGWTGAAASNQKISTSTSFSMTGSGTVGGCFLVFGSGALSTVDNTGGYLYSAGAFTSKTVSSGDILNVVYTASL